MMRDIMRYVHCILSEGTVANHPRPMTLAVAPPVLHKPPRTRRQTGLATPNQFIRNSGQFVESEQTNYLFYS